MFGGPLWRPAAGTGRLPGDRCFSASCPAACGKGPHPQAGPGAGLPLPQVPPCHEDWTLPKVVGCQCALGGWRSFCRGWPAAMASSSTPEHHLVGGSVADMLIDILSECWCNCSSGCVHESGAVSGATLQAAVWDGVSGAQLECRLSSWKDTGFGARVCFLGASRDFLSTPVASVVIVRSGTGQVHVCP